MSTEGLVTGPAQTGFRNRPGVDGTPLNSTAAAGDGNQRAWIFIDDDIYSLDANNNLSLLGPHGLTNVTAATWWEQGQRIVVVADNQLLLYNPVTLTSTPTNQAIPDGIRSIAIHQGLLYGVSEQNLFKFSADTLRLQTPQARDERIDYWEVSVRDRRTHALLEDGILTQSAVNRMEINWRWEKAGVATLTLILRHTPLDIINALVSGRGEIFFTRNWQSNDGEYNEQFVGIPMRAVFYKTPTDHTTFFMGDLENAVIMLGRKYSRLRRSRM